MWQSTRDSYSSFRLKNVVIEVEFSMSNAPTKRERETSSCNRKRNDNFHFWPRSSEANYLCEKTIIQMLIKRTLCVVCHNEIPLPASSFSWWFVGPLESRGVRLNFLFENIFNNFSFLTSAFNVLAHSLRLVVMCAIKCVYNTWRAPREIYLQKEWEKKSVN